MHTLQHLSEPNTNTIHRKKRTDYHTQTHRQTCSGRASGCRDTGLLDRA